MAEEPHTQRNKVMFRLVLAFVIIGLGYAAYYWFYARFYEYTDDAYVNGNQVILTPQVPGIVTSITADNTDLIAQGRPLVFLDPTDAQIALDASIAALNNTVREVIQLFETVQELEAQLKIKEAVWIRAEQDFAHREAVVQEGGVSLEDFEHAIAELDAAMADVERTEHAYLGALAQVKNTTVTTHPRVTEAIEQVKMAYIQRRRCTLLAPVTGLVAQRNVQVGQQVSIGEPLLAVIPLNQMWVDANFKETQLKSVRIGQPVHVRSDLWGSGVLLHGKVVGIGAGTGSIFSVLPPQNATGNWIKIVQRIPVRIGLLPQEIERHPLRLGMSMEVTVDIREDYLAEIPPERPEGSLYETPVFSHQEVGVDALIQQILLDAQGLSPWPQNY